MQIASYSALVTDFVKLRLIKFSDLPLNTLPEQATELGIARKILNMAIVVAIGYGVHNIHYVSISGLFCWTPKSVIFCLETAVLGDILGDIEKGHLTNS